MKFRDIEIICKDCNKPFIFSAAQQMRYEEISQERVEHGEDPLTQPKRCNACRIAKKKKHGDI